MYYDLMINFEDIINHQVEMLRYAGKNSDNFTVITTLKKPYSKRPPNFVHDKIMMDLFPYMVDYTVGIKEWPGTYRSGGSHTVMITYRLCKSSRYLLEKLENWYLPLQNGLPEDICFYRKQKPWFGSVSHEKMAFMWNATESDCANLKSLSIKFLIQNKKVEKSF